MNASKLRRPIDRCAFYLGFAAFLSSSAVGCLAGHAAETAVACSSPTPVYSVSGNQFYEDAKGSIVDPEKMVANETAQRPVGKFLFGIEKVLDSTTVSPPQLACAARQMHDWAIAGALLSEPASRQGSIERIFYSFGLNVIALKFRYHGVTLDDETISWLRALTYSVIEVYKRNGRQGNLTNWAAASAALFALLARDKNVIDFENSIWSTGLGLIGDDGYIATELARGRRALIYHQFSLSALLILRQSRTALGEVPTSAQDKALTKLSDMIGRALCAPSYIAAAAGAEQETPDQTAFRPEMAFSQGLLSGDWERCGKTPITAWSNQYGGDFLKTAAAVISAGSHIK